MSIFQSLNTTASALTAQRLRMDVISSNMANVDTTRAKFVDGQWQPYRRKLVVMEPNEGSFSSYLQVAMNSRSAVGNGVKVTKIIEDETPFKLVYDPTHPDANRDGYVQLPNVDPLKEMVDLMSATRSYEANVTVFNATKGMLMKALEIGK
ncbi:flagellar basal-body rod protein FlgC [Anoxybacillus tepidamans]|uniref:Flagellar basal-body rod protein FlgC n=1 Tax=Anoxybacteroides tepidamans TaxID=265948 RepID=A0A7W8IQ38_9BACL|nr:flagellar basal body rod protein FlgC [Anoxybacillus tepidamans]MBB5323679.1 flagellar basal-body rod protein FlgC [Anoxybacillus tepidamans]